MIDLVSTDVDTRRCDGIRRRDFIRVGALTALGLTLPDILRLEARAGGAPRKEISCILLWMNGGPSQLDSFDPKPDAPTQIRGEFKTIPTSIPGIRFTELLPRMAKSLDKFSVLRSVTSPENEHDRATHYLLSGYGFTPALEYPSYGSVITREFGNLTDMPPYVLLGTYPFGYGGGGYMGAQYNPLNITDDPNDSNFRVRDVTLPKGFTVERVQRRRSILEAIDTFRHEVEASQVRTLGSFYERAYDLVSSPLAKRAFDLSREPEKVRDRYGRTQFGQSCLLARRLVESGVRFVTVESAGWDTHQKNFRLLRDDLLPPVDVGYSALLEDLETRGLLDNTLVVWMGEFGRTPKVNPAAGRDHWGRAMIVNMGGGGINRGLVIGKTNERAEEPIDRPIRVEDVAATIYKALGVEYTEEYVTPENQPVRINYDGVPVDELF